MRTIIRLRGLRGEHCKVKSGGIEDGYKVKRGKVVVVVKRECNVSGDVVDLRKQSIRYYDG